MEKVQQYSLWLWVLIIIGLSSMMTAQAADILDVRVSENGMRTRMVLDLSGKVDYKQFSLSGPDRVVLDIDHGHMKDATKLPGKTGVLQKIRTGKHGGDGTRMVLDLGHSVKVEDFLLTPRDGKGYRLVVDLVHGKSSDATNKAPVQVATTPAKAQKAVTHKPHAKVVSNDAKQQSKRNRKAEEQRLLKSARDIVVAIDAGHGGKDSGARSRSGTMEKTITLQVSRKLAHAINQQKGMKAVLTRNSDIFIPLQRRYQIAREHNADVFVSIHADAFKNPNAKGSSVWVLSPTGKTSEAARWLADRENRADLLGGVTLSDKSDSLASVLLDLQQSYAQEVSENIAANVHNRLARIGPTHRNYVEKANFVVLRSPDVPSLLVETGFITNPATERLLRSPTYQNKLADAVLMGVQDYFKKAPPAGTLYALQAQQRRGELVSMQSGTGSNGKHKVGRGDTLSGIARRYGVSANAIKSANHMTSNVVHKGTVLTIPTS